MKRIFKRIWEIRSGETTAALRDSQIVADLPLPLTPTPAPTPRKGRGETSCPQKLAKEVLRMVQESVDETSLGSWPRAAGA